MLPFQKWKSTILEIERVIIPSGVQGGGGGKGVYATPGKVFLQFFQEDF